MQLKPAWRSPSVAGKRQDKRQWLSTLLAGSPKHRFFQLSADLTTLRWSWNK
jgi:hypothetical protein